MGYKRLSEQPTTNVIKDDDSIIGVFDGKLGLANVNNWLSKINASFDITVDSDTDEEYILSITVGRKTITTPNLKNVSIQNALIESGHLYFNMSDGSIIDAGIVTSNVKKYGVCYDMNSANPKLTRLGDARYMRAETANGPDDTNVVNDFDNVYPWCDIKRCTVIADGTVTSYEGDPDYIENGSMGEVMTEIPEHYEMKYISEATGKMYYYVSEEKLNEYYKFVPKKYIGSFLMTDVLASWEASEGNSAESRVGRGRYASTYSFQDAQTLAKAKGKGWHQFDIFDYETVKTLFLIEFATLDSQSIYLGSDNISSRNIKMYPSEECCLDVLNSTNNVTETEFEVDYFIAEKDSFFVGDYVEIEVLKNDTPTELDYEDSGSIFAIRRIEDTEPIDATQYPDIADNMCVYYMNNNVVIGKEGSVYIVTELNGLLNSIRASSGKLPYHGHENGGFVYRGLEYFLSVSYTWIDGIIIHDGKYWICDNPDNYSKSIYKFDENGNATEELLYKEITAFQIPNTGFISKMGYDEETGLTLPVETNGGSNTGYCDSFGKPSSSNAMNIVRWRTQTYAQSAQASHSGLFSWSCSSPSTSRPYYSARLSYSHS